MKNAYLAVWPALAFICLVGSYGCKKELATSSGESSAQGNSVSVTAFSPDSAGRAAAVNDYQVNYLGSSISSTGWVGDPDNCDAGTTPDATKQKVLQRLNYFRRLSGVPAVVLDANYSAEAQEAALIMRDNNALNHYPPTTWKCVTPTGQLAAANSNLALGTGGSGAIDLYIADEGVTALGHRRWALFPALDTVGTGDTDYTNALWVIGGFGTRPSIEYSAYPGNGYIPAPLVYDVWSFSVSAADFSGATVTVTDAKGISYPVTISQTGNGYGDNTLAWTFQQSFSQISTDLQLNVSVSEVKVSGQTKSFQYSVYIMAL
jgi:uncharacterized protein YkwD